MSGHWRLLVDVCAANRKLLHRQPRRLPDQQEARHPNQLRRGPHEVGYKIWNLEV